VFIIASGKIGVNCLGCMRETDFRKKVCGEEFSILVVKRRLWAHLKEIERKEKIRGVIKCSIEMGRR